MTQTNTEASQVKIVQIIAKELSKGLDLSLPPLDREVARAALKMLGKNALKSEH